MKIGIILAAATALTTGTAFAQSTAAPDSVAAQQQASSTAQAQAAPATAQAPADSGAAQASFTPAEIASFAKAATKIGDIQQATTMDNSQKQVAMAAVVEESGLDVNRFNAMSQATRTDPTLQKKVQAALVEAQQGHGGHAGHSAQKPATKPAE